MMRLLHMNQNVHLKYNISCVEKQRLQLNLSAKYFYVDLPTWCKTFVLNAWKEKSLDCVRLLDARLVTRFLRFVSHIVNLKRGEDNHFSSVIETLPKLLQDASNLSVLRPRGERPPPLAALLLHILGRRCRSGEVGLNNTVTVSLWQRRRHWLRHRQAPVQDASLPFIFVQLASALLIPGRADR